MPGATKPLQIEKTNVKGATNRRLNFLLTQRRSHIRFRNKP